MTTAARPRYVDYLEDGVTTAFPLPFRFRAASDIKAQRTALDGSRAMLVYGSDYTVTGGTTDAGGTLTVSTPAAAGVKLSLWCETRRGQQTDYPTLGTFPSKSHEEALDRLDLVDQEQDEKIDRAVSVPRGQTVPQLDMDGVEEGDLLTYSGGRLQRLNPAPFAGKFYAGGAGGKLVPADGTGADAALRAELGLPGGPDRIGYSPSEPFGPDSLGYAVQGKADRFPPNPYSSILASYPRALADAKANWWNGTNILPTVGDGGALNGLPNPTPGVPPSMWQMWTLFNAMIYEPWVLAVDNGDTAAAAELVAMAAAQWSYIKTQFTFTNIKRGTGGVVNTSDDGRLHVMGLTQIHEMTGASDAKTAAEECLWYSLGRFHDGLQTQIDYGDSTPDGTACKSDPYGMLYAAAGDWGFVQGYGYISSSNEFGFALAALYLYDAGVSTAAACLAYAQDVAQLGVDHFLTPAPADSGKTAQYLVYLGLNLDPNVAAANATASAGSISGNTFTEGGTVTGSFAVGQYLRGAGVTPGTKINGGTGPTWSVDISQTVAATAINGSLAKSGHGDSNQVYREPQNAFYGRPLRGTSSVYLGGSCLFAALQARLYDITGDSAHLTHARNTTNAIASLQGFGRQLSGVPYLIQARDPWSDGDGLPELARRCLGLPGVDPDGTLKLAIANSAKSILAGSVDGYLTPDWFPRERGTNGTDTWLDDGAKGYGGSYGGGQAKPQQILVHGSSLALVVAAARIAPAMGNLGSGVGAPISVESLASEVVALKAALNELLARQGGVLVGRLAFRVNDFYVDLNAAGWPYINWANNVIDQYDPDAAERQFYVGTTSHPAMTIAANNLGARVWGPLRFSAEHGDDTFAYNNGTDVLFNIAPGMAFVGRPGTKKVGILIDNVVVWSVGASGAEVGLGGRTTGTPTLT